MVHYLSPCLLLTLCFCLFLEDKGFELLPVITGVPGAPGKESDLVYEQGEYNNRSQKAHFSPVILEVL